MTSTTETRTFAIRIGNMVELRVGRRTPRIHLSKLTKDVIVKERYHEYVNHAPWCKVMWRDVPKKVILKQTAYLGGRWVGLVSYPVYSRVVGNLFPNCCTEITKEERKALQKYKT